MLNTTPDCDTGFNANMKTSVPTPAIVNGTSTVSPAVNARPNFTVTVFVPPFSATAPDDAETATHNCPDRPDTVTPVAEAALVESLGTELRAITEIS